MTREQIAALPCPLGGMHMLTRPTTFVGTSCRKCHRTWEGPDLKPTWPDPEESE